MPPAIHHTRPAGPGNGEGVGSTCRGPDREGRPSLEEHGCQRAREAAAAEVDARERAGAGEFGG